MLTAARLILLCGLASSQSGCILYVYAYFATIPSPKTAIDVTWAADDQLCRSIIARDSEQDHFVGLSYDHYSSISDLDYDGRKHTVWRRPTEAASFTLLKDRFGPAYNDGIGRGVFDFDNDGQIDVVYVIPPPRWQWNAQMPLGARPPLGHIIVVPATDASRVAFESRLGHYVSGWQEDLKTQGIRIYSDSELIDKMAPAYSFGILRQAQTTYLLASLPEVSFDPKRPGAPSYDGAWDGWPPRTSAWPADLYRLEPLGGVRKVCSFLKQSAYYSVGGF